MIYPSITSTAHNHLETVKEAEKYGIKEICLFVTCLSLEERKEIYSLLEGTEISSIPLVHIRNDMELWEFDYLSNRFFTKVFNCHPSADFPLKNEISGFSKKTYIENTGSPLVEEEVKKYAGVCLDFSHLRGAYFLDKERFENDLKMIEKYPIGCAHISAFRKPDLKDYVCRKADSLHILKNLSDVNYLGEYQKYFPQIMALELENNLQEQLGIINYLSSKTWASKV